MQSLLESGSPSSCCNAGIESGTDPRGFPAALRSAASSISSHASVMRSGTTATVRFRSQVSTAATAFSISARRRSRGSDSASRCTKSRSHGNNLTAWATRAANGLGGELKRLRSAQSMLTAKGTCCRRTHCRTGIRARSLGPSVRSVQRSSINPRARRRAVASARRGGPLPWAISPARHLRALPSRAPDSGRTAAFRARPLPHRLPRLSRCREGRSKRSLSNRAPPLAISLDSATRRLSSGTWDTTAGEWVLTITCRSGLSSPTGSFVSVAMS